eukprot:CAMPEP_0201484250 /NCGR_PEP_ID=MMETSP0151_2-20130828/8446_1 /ASSEMBLY_ACC=CAM_ASM_000257 /TAXON_ID=200890 /ORGANISM="Paramoeba atlantica, Strain 621/1 / CCAP 1560/9" /LENGTH=305 /DNA_ID=CAMNT_0047867829 /DNA_START=72 /DNA_END=989 /DNA_ORIENTATION=-
MEAIRYCANLRELLEKGIVEDVASSNRRLVFVSSVTTVHDTLTALLENQTSGAPVLDLLNMQFNGEFIDLNDLVAYLSTIVEQSSTLPSNFAEHQVSYILEHIPNKKKSLPTVFSNQKLMDCLPHLIDNPRVPVLHPLKLEVASIITQSDFVRFFAKHITTISPQLCQTPLSALFDFSTTFITKVPISAPIIQAFAALHQNRATTAAVVDETGALQLSLSVSDLKGLSVANLADLFLPVREYMGGSYARLNKIMTPTVTCSGDTTFETVLMRFAATGVHNLFIVNSISVFFPLLIDPLRFLLIDI